MRWILKPLCWMGLHVIRTHSTEKDWGQTVKRVRCGVCGKYLAKK